MARAPTLIVGPRLTRTMRGSLAGRGMAQSLAEILGCHLQSVPLPVFEQPFTGAIGDETRSGPLAAQVYETARIPDPNA